MGELLCAKAKVETKAWKSVRRTNVIGTAE